MIEPAGRSKTAIDAHKLEHVRRMLDLVFA
jgi:hypothetical protein